MNLINTVAEMQKIRKGLIGKTVGFVPTMGALHEGHAELIHKSKQQNNVTILSIFVNPTQFNDKNDFEKYPISLELDCKLAEESAVDFVFAPNYESLYPDNYSYKLSENQLSKRLCGLSRPGHFDGVLTVVMKLLQIMRPDRVYFGEKDYQQLLLIKGMINAFFLDAELVPVKTVREQDGLAKSSRNVRLTESERKTAALLYKYLSSNLEKDEIIEKLTLDGFKIDYFEEVFDRKFIAAKLGNVRLIDNVEK